LRIHDNTGADYCQADGESNKTGKPVADAAFGSFHSFFPSKKAEEIFVNYKKKRCLVLLSQHEQPGRTCVSARGRLKLGIN
jgi:hypothetical protein